MGETCKGVCFGVNTKTNIPIWGNMSWIHSYLFFYQIQKALTDILGPNNCEVSADPVAHSESILLEQGAEKGGSICQYPYFKQTIIIILISSILLPLLVRQKKAKKGPEVEVEYVQTFIAVYCSLGCVHHRNNMPPNILRWFTPIWHLT